MKNYYVLFLLLVCFLLVSPVFADNVTMPSAATLKPFMVCRLGVTQENSCTLPNGEYPKFEFYPGTSSRTWDGKPGGYALAGVDFETPVNSATTFTLITANQTITGEIVVTADVFTTTKILTLNGVSRTFVTYLDPFIKSKFFISMYALNLTTNKFGIVLYNAGIFEASSITTQEPGHEIQVLSTVSEENVFVTIEGLTPVRVITFSCTQPNNVGIWYADTNIIASSLATLQTPLGAVGVPLAEFESLVLRLIPSLWASYLAFVDLIIELILSMPMIFVLYEVVVTLLAFFNCSGNIFRGIKSWWSAQKKFVSFVFYGLDIIEDHWQAFAVASAIVIIGKLYAIFYAWAHFVTWGAV